MSKIIRTSNLFMRNCLIKARNEIIDNPFKYYNPLYWNDLKFYDDFLDELPLTKVDYLLMDILEIEPAYVYTTDEDLYQKISKLSFK